MKSFSPRGLTAALVTLSALAAYIVTLAPSVTFIDAGELAAAACTLGIAHPTGYPLFTLLGRLFSLLPFPGEEIVRLNLMAAVCCAGAVALFFYLVEQVLRVIEPPNKGNAVSRLASSAAASFLLGFSGTWWSQATAVEVYSLHVLLLGASLLLFVRAALGEPHEERWWTAFALVLGLAFSNHMTTILLAPGLLYLYFATQGSRKASWLRLLRLVPLFLLGLLPYVYLPLRAAQSPMLNWGFPATLERFFWHVSGKQYRVWLFSSSDVAGRQLSAFISSLPAQFAYAGLLFAIVGIVALWRGGRHMAVASLILMVSCVVYSINYDIHDIESYFLLAYMCVALWAGCGFYAVANWAVGAGWKPALAAGAVLLVGLAPLGMHGGHASERGNHLVEDYTTNMFASFQPGALALSYQWDYWVSASYYYQFVKGVRQDVTVVDKELLRRSWYLRQLGTQHPWLVRGSQQEVDAFLREVDKFEHDRPYAAPVIQARYVAMIRSFVARGMERGAVYVTAEVEQEFTPGLQRVPEGLAFRLYADTLYHPLALPDFSYRPFGRQGRLEDMTRRLYAEALAAHAEYAFFRGGNKTEAQIAIKKALSFDPSAPLVRRLEGAIR